MNPFIVLLVGILALSGCAETPKLNRLSAGMTKQEVIAIMGQPDTTASPGPGTEYLRYSLSTSGWEAFNDVAEPYFVELANGKVIAYGHVGDFGSAQNPGVDVNVNWRNVR
jgi:hypothetical protein